MNLWYVGAECDALLFYFPPRTAREKEERKKESHTFDTQLNKHPKFIRLIKWNGRAFSFKLSEQYE